jgi:hypothetical protein
MSPALHRNLIDRRVLILTTRAAGRRGYPMRPPSIRALEKHRTKILLPRSRRSPIRRCRTNRANLLP